MLISEARESGAHESAACQEMGINQRTLQRWRSEGAPQEDQRPLAKRPVPYNKLNEEETMAVIATANQPEFQSMPPSQIVPILADRGVYLA